MIPPRFRPSPAAWAEAALAGGTLSEEDARAVLAWPDEEVLDLAAAAHRVRRARSGSKVKLNYLVNLQSGLCPEDCSYCGQSSGSEAGVEKYRLLSEAEALAAADRAAALGAGRVCFVASMRGPGERDVAAVEGLVRRVRERHPDLEVCASLGLLKEGQADRLRAAGVHAYNHNLNTSASHYGKICSTHTHGDRVATVERAKASGLSPCSGAIFGMGETDEDVLEVAFRVRAMKIDSIPINFLIPVPGIRLEERGGLTPLRCLKILCLFRFLNPKAELRIAGGRELHLRSLQPLGLLIADSIFLGDYLTTKGAPAPADLAMMADLGLSSIAPADLPVPPPEVERVTRATRQ